jgi:hypothetical protein
MRSKRIVAIVAECIYSRKPRTAAGIGAGVKIGEIEAMNATEVTRDERADVVGRVSRVVG